MANRTIKTAQLHRKMIKNKKKVVYMLLHLDFHPQTAHFTPIFYAVMQLQIILM